MKANDTSQKPELIKEHSPNKSPFDVIDSIGARFFETSAIATLFAGASLTIYILILQVSNWMQLKMLSLASLQLYFPIESQADLGPTPSIALNSLISLVWNSWIGYPLLVGTVFFYLLFRKIGHEFRR